MEEIWKDVPGYEGLYRISNMGRVYGIKRKHIMLLDYSAKGYARVTLNKNNNPTRFSVHYLVMVAFCGERNGRQINHIDRNPANNCITNLEYCTASENMQHAYRTGHAKKKAVVMLDDNGNNLREFDSIAEAERATGAHFISTRIRKHQRTAGHYWKYREEISA